MRSASPAWLVRPSPNLTTVALAPALRRMRAVRRPGAPPALQGTNPIPDFRAIVSCQSIGAGGTAAITNVSTAYRPGGDCHRR